MALAYWSSPFVAVLTAQSHRSFAGLSKGLHRDRAHLAQWHLSEYKVEGYLISGVFVDYMVLFTLEYSFPHPLKKKKHLFFLPCLSYLRKMWTVGHIPHISHFVHHVFFLNIRSENAIGFSVGSD